MVTHTITSAVWLLPLFFLSNTHTEEKEGCGKDTFTTAFSSACILFLSQVGQHNASVGNDTYRILSSARVRVSDCTHILRYMLHGLAFKEIRQNIQAVQLKKQCELEQLFIIVFFFDEYLL